MSTARRLHHSYGEYLDLLRQNDTKLEYCDGEIFAMAGGTLAHAEIGGAMIALLSEPVPPYASPLMVRRMGSTSGTRCLNPSAGPSPTEETHVLTSLMAQVGELGVLAAANRSIHPSCGLPAEGRKEASLVAHRRHVSG